MRLKVPFYKGEEGDCGPLSLKMVLEYFGSSYSKKELSERMCMLDTRTVYTIGIAKAARELGFEVEFFSENRLDGSHRDFDYYRKFGRHEKEVELYKEAENVGVEIRGSLSMEELLSNVNKDSIPIVLLNWNVIRKKPDYHGHVVPVTGYTKKSVYVHNTGPQDAKAFFPMSRSKFKKAWESPGTDKDTVIIRRK